MNKLKELTEKDKQSLVERTVILSRKEKIIKTVNDDSMMVFFIGEQQKYGIDYKMVDKVVFNLNPVKIPDLNGLIDSIIYYRSELIPVVKLSMLLEINYDRDDRNYVFIKHLNQRYALEVNEIVGQKEFNNNQAINEFSTHKGLNSTYTLGIYDKDIAVIDIEKVLNTIENIKLT